MMKGKDKFTSAEILELRELIAERQNASRNYQKQLRNRMRKIGFFGRDDWGIIDCTLEDLDELIDTERIKIIDKITSTIITDKSKSKNAIINQEINKNIEKNGGTTYGVLSDYMSDNDIEAVNIILPFSHNIIPTGCYVQIPEGYEIQVRPRSGIGAKTNMIAHWGTIDNDYRGNIGIIINNPSPNSYIILPNERLAQGVFAKVEQCEFKKVKSIEELTKTDRGEGGFGSTGK